MTLKIPILSSPMDTVSEGGMALAMALGDAGASAIVHRYNTIPSQARHIRSAKDRAGNINVGAAIGVTHDYIERAHAAYEAGATFICVDVAHGTTCS